MEIKKYIHIDTPYQAIRLLGFDADPDDELWDKLSALGRWHYEKTGSSEALEIFTSSYLSDTLDFAKNGS